MSDIAITKTRWRERETYSCACKESLWFSSTSFASKKKANRYTYIYIGNSQSIKWLLLSWHDSNDDKDDISTLTIYSMQKKDLYYTKRKKKKERKIWQEKLSSSSSWSSSFCWCVFMRSCVCRMSTYIWLELNTKANKNAKEKKKRFS